MNANPADDENITYKLYGHILPDHSKVIFPPLEVKNAIAQEDLHYTVTISIKDSEIEAICKTNRFGEKENAAIYNTVRHIVESGVSLISFKEATLITVIMDHAILPDGKDQALAWRFPPLQPLCTAFSYEDLPHFETAKGPLRWVLRDLIGALNPEYALINCARAIDCVRNSISPEEEDDKLAWQKMHRVLRVDPEYQKFITIQSRKHRHARYEEVTGPVVEDVLTRSWKIVDRYIHFLKRGGTEDLPESEFPLLRA